MASYELHSTVPSPGSYTTFIEFSPNGRFLAVGDRDFSSLYLLDRRAGFHPTLSVITPAKPTALVWETSGAFYVGLADGRFTFYQIDLGGEKLVEGMTNHAFRGVFPITAMALDVDSKTLVLSVGPEVFVFRRIRATSTFRLSMN
jgi:WD40 repeat protein